MKRKITVVFIAMIMVLGLAAIALPVTAKADSSGYFTYDPNGSLGANITGYTGTNMDVVIPDTLDNGRAVVGIADNAFQGTGITSVSIPASVTYLGSSTFSGCTSLSSVTFRTGSILNSIYGGAFCGCTALTSITIPAGVSDPGNSIFQGCTHLSDVEFAAGSILPKIGESDFLGCSELTSITIPSSVTSIDVDAFYNSGLTSITIPSSVETIASEAFYQCPLTGVTIQGNKLYSIGFEAFYYCQQLLSLALPASVHDIGSGAFQYDNKLATVTFGTGSVLKSIGQNAFESCTALTGIALPAGFNSLGDLAFHGDTLCASVSIPGSLTTISGNSFQETGIINLTIPEGVTEIQHDAFNSCPALDSVSLPSTLKTIGDTAFCGCDALTSITIPAGVTTLGDGSIGGCSLLSNITLNEGLITIGPNGFQQDPITQLTIPSTVTSIGDYSFSSCPHLQKVTVLNSTMAFSGDNIFESSTLNDDPSYGIYGYYGSTADTYASSHTISGDPINFHACTLVSFDSNGGSTVPSQFVEGGKLLTRPGNPAKDHYMFGGWFMDPGLAPGSIWDFPSDTFTADHPNNILYAKWDPDSFTVTFNAGTGVTVSPASKTVYYASTYGTLPTPSKTGYDFNGWYTGTGGTGTQVTDSTTVGLTADQTLYAKWTAYTYTVNYNANANGTAGSTASSAHTYDVYKALTANGFSRPGYGFAGWAANQSGSVVYSNSQSIVNLTAEKGGLVTLYAVWSANVYTVTFDAGAGGTVNTASIKATYGETYGSLPTPVKPGYNFNGWYIGAGGTGTQIASSTTVSITGDQTLYANWTAQPATANLTGIICSPEVLKPTFTQTRLTYSIELNENTQGVTVTPIRENTSASMAITCGKQTSPTSLYVQLANGGKATVKINVALGKLKKTYTLTVTRDKSSDNKLAKLNYNYGTLNMDFDPNVTSGYVLTLPENTASVTVGGTADSPLEKVTSASKSYKLNYNQSKAITIKVKAQNGQTRTYNITIHRNACTDTGIKITNSRNIAVVNYVEYDAYMIRITPKQSPITVKFKGTGYGSKTTVGGIPKTSMKVTLPNGYYEWFDVVVTSQAGNSSTYEIIVLCSY